jgi:flagellar basal-body rod protein FlgB
MKLVEGEAPMFEKLEITAMAQAMASHAGARLGVISQNMANADTPGYKARDVADFASVWAAGQHGGGMRATRSGHLGSDAKPLTEIIVAGSGASAPNGNSVSLEGEMVKAVEVRQQHDMALAIYRNSTDIIHASLSRR